MKEYEFTPSASVEVNVREGVREDVIVTGSRVAYRLVIYILRQQGRVQVSHIYILRQQGRIQVSHVYTTAAAAVCCL